MTQSTTRSLRCALLAALVLPAACSDSLQQATAPVATPQAVMAANATIPGEYIVVLKPGAVTSSVMPVSLTATGSGKVRHTYKHAITGFAAELSDAEVAQLRSNPNVEAVYANQPVHLAETQTNAIWGLDRIDQRDLPLNRRYDYTSTGAGVTVYVIDSGIRATHSEFEGRAVAVDVTNDPLGARDCNGHGTHVAGTVGGKTYGVAKGVNLVGVKMFHCSEGSSLATFLAALEWVIANVQRPAVINMSLLAPSFEPIDQAVRTLHSMGVLSVIAAGNFSAYGCDWSPHAVSEALLVGATERNDNRAEFSNTGPCVDVHAPGVEILSAGITSDDASNFNSGTSMAAPHAAGVAALYLENRPAASATRVHDAIIAAASPDRLNMRGADDTPNHMMVNTFGAQRAGPWITVNTKRLAFTFVTAPLGLIQLASILEPTESQSVKLTNFGDAPLDWRATTSEPWISFGNANGLLAPGGHVMIDVHASRANLGAGIHEGSFTISAPGSANGARTVPVRLTVIEAARLPIGERTAPFGGAEDSERYYVVHVPEDVRAIRFRMGVGTGDADMSVRFGAVPTDNRSDCEPFLDSAVEVCEFTNPTAGLYFVRIFGFSAYSGHNLLTTIESIPAAVTTLNAAAVSSSRIRLEWIEGSSNESEFVIQRRSYDGASWSGWEEVTRTRANAWEFTDRGRVAGVKYQYRIRPCNSLGCAEYVSANASIPLPPVVPEPITVSATSATSTRVFWSNVAGETEYRVQKRYRAGDVWSAWTEVTLPADSRRYDEAALTTGMFYQYRVRACNVGGCSGFTGAVGVRTR